jgi:UDP-hydrolysing UDP-N-acetyl-D-glucosamine 2-epimerase
VEVQFLLGNSVWLYKFGDVHSYIKRDFPDIKINRVSMNADGDDLSKMSKSVGMGCIEISTIIDNIEPTMMITVADRYETLATATAAAYVNLPLIHIQGGEVSGTIDDKVRNCITQLADFHFPATDKAKFRILMMKPQDGSFIWNYGCPSMDTLLRCRTLTRDIMIDTAFDEIHRHGDGDQLDPSKDFIIVMVHPDTKDYIGKDQLDNLMDVLNTLPLQKVIFWNNIDPGGEVIAKEIRWTQAHYWKDNVRYLRHVDSYTFGCLMSTSRCIIGNSSAGIREATFLGTPSVSLGLRQSGRECGANVVRCNFDKNEILEKTVERISHRPYPSDMYGDGNAGIKIANTILDVINDV